MILISFSRRYKNKTKLTLRIKKMTTSDTLTFDDDGRIDFST